MSVGRNNGTRFEPWVDAAILVLIVAYLGYWFPPRLLFSPTMTAGGDTPTHYFTALYLRSFLLPRGLVSGWAAAHYAGFPILELYFPLPFLLIAAASLVIGLPVAFKLGTILGVFLLPFSSYAAARLLGQRFPVPALAAVLALPFLFLESNTFWGGNIPSVLSGEFAYSLGLALAIAWIGLLHRQADSDRPARAAAGPAALLALIGLSHGYALLFCGVSSLILLLPRRTFAARLTYLSWVHGLAILLLSFWLLPLILNLKWTTPLIDRLAVSDWTKICPSILYPTLALTAWAVLLERTPALWRVLGAFGCAALLFLVGPSLGVVDFRFLPFAQAVLALTAAIGLGRLTRPLRGRLAIPFLVAIAAAFWIDLHVGFIPSWIEWNYSGLEAKTAWPLYSGISRWLAGGLGAPRVFFEHSARNEALGSLRAWECLPVFSGRSILEGAYHQASPSSPFIFYLESEVSISPACPFPDYGCAVLDPGRAKRHFDLFNVKDVIVVSPQSKAAFASAKGYRLERSLGPYRIFERDGPHRYVDALAFEPVLWAGREPWKQVSYSWFRNDRINDVHLVFAESASARDLRRIPLRTETLEGLPRRRVRGALPPLWEKVSEDEVEFETETPGKPYLIKVSYHPNWTVEGAEAIYLTSPSLMLVYPTGRRVHLRCERSRSQRWGLVLTLLGLCLWAAAWRRSAEPALGFLLRLRLPALLLFAALFARLSWTAVQRRLDSSWSSLNEAIRDKDEGRTAQAERIFRRLIAASPSSYFAEQSSYALADCEYAEGKLEAALADYGRSLADYANSPLEARAYARMIECAHRLGMKDREAILRRETASRFPAAPAQP